MPWRDESRKPSGTSCGVNRSWTGEREAVRLGIAGFVLTDYAGDCRDGRRAVRRDGWCPPHEVSGNAPSWREDRKRGSTADGLRVALTGSSAEERCRCR